MFRIVSILCFALACASAVALDDAVSEARQLISSQKYDQAIDLMNKYLVANPDSASGHLLLAEAFHWKKDVGNAKSHYDKAGELDEGLKYAVIPLMDETKDWDGIIKLVEPIKNKRCPASLLGPLATAYTNLNRKDDSARVIAILESTKYFFESERDYQHYVLAYANLWNDNRDDALKHLKSIHDSGLLRYAASSDKFKKLHDDVDFKKLTETKN
jgi:hypothetical protein